VVLDDHQQAGRTSPHWTNLGPEVEVEFWSEHVEDEDVLVDRLQGAAIVVAMRERTPFPARILERLPDLRLLVTTGPFNAAIDVAAADGLGIVVSGTGGFREPTAELAWGLIHACTRHIPAEDAALRSGRWQTTVGGDLKGRRLGLLGLGHLGTAVAQVGRAFGMDVVAWSQNLTGEDAAAKGVVAVTREELFGTADILSIHLVLSERTHHLVGAAELEAMKPTAILVNTSRGGIVDEAALCEALASGQIAGAGLDVYEHEPLPASSPLRTLPNTVLTPHLGYVTEGTYDLFYREIVEDIAAYLAGEPIRVLAP
jgi:phosphoglycerate dehydrogenase-like enzyme